VGQRLGLLLEHECLHRDNCRLIRLLKAAKLRTGACVVDIDYRHPRGIDRAYLAILTQGHWIEQHQNLCITGWTGTGKTWLACALGNQACRRRHLVRHYRLPRVFEQLRPAHGDGSYSRLMNQMAKTELPILDDRGLHILSAAQRNDLTEVIEDRKANASTLIASQLPVESGNELVGDATLANTILDRLIHKLRS